MLVGCSHSLGLEFAAGNRVERRTIIDRWLIVSTHLLEDGAGAAGWYSSLDGAVLGWLLEPLGLVHIGTPAFSFSTHSRSYLGSIRPHGPCMGILHLSVGGGHRSTFQLHLPKLFERLTARQGQWCTKWQFHLGQYVPRNQKVYLVGIPPWAYTALNELLIGALSKPDQPQELSSTYR